MASAFDSLAQGAIDTVYNVFAEEVEIVSGQSSTVARGVFTLRHEGEPFAGVAPEAPVPTVELLQHDAAATGVAEGDIARIRGTEYRVISLMPADDGTVLLGLQEY